jgi:hypothetical protein
MDRIQKLEKIIFEYANKIGASENLLPVLGINDFAHPYIEIDSDGNYNYIIRERGQEYERKIYFNELELLFKVFENVTFSMATSFELKNRIESQDCRIIIFAKQEELLGILNKEWSKKQKIKHQTYLNKS